MAALGKVLDFSEARPDPGKAKTAGYLGFYRYVCSDASEEEMPGKRLTPAEQKLYLDTGLDVGLHGEDESGAAEKGAARGTVQGKQWATYAHDVLQWPVGSVIVAAVDFNTAAFYGNPYPAVVDEYLHAIEEALAQATYHLGTYGDHGVFTGADFNDVLRVPLGTFRQPLTTGDDMDAQEHQWLADIHAAVTGPVDPGT